MENLLRGYVLKLEGLLIGMQDQSVNSSNNKDREVKYCTISVLHNVSCFESNWLRRLFTMLLNPSRNSLGSKVGLDLDGPHCLGTQAICSIQNIYSDYKQRDCDAVRLEEL